ncbi:diguanylate cyclase, partial [Pseudoalteromonas sp. MIP2626]|uniref:diguanylate cyclase n=1 Tax=Pseudoalteromonas sp. MIP2626 TaxID=2705464 RepID=UPI00211BD0D1
SFLANSIIPYLHAVCFSYHKDQHALVNTDGLTNIANRRCFDETLKSEIQRCARNKHSLSLIMCDIDFFKRYNDNYGHQKGDDALKLVAKTLNQLCRREGDLAARYGGEEFAIILPSLNAAECHQFALLLQQKIALLNKVHSDSSVAKTLTLSVGFYSTYPTKNTRPETIINNADAALYEAKETGRNKICQFFESN